VFLEKERKVGLAIAMQYICIEEKKKENFLFLFSHSPKIADGGKEKV